MEILKHYQNQALSNYDLIKLLNNKANIVIYPELINYDNIDQVLGPHGACFLLFEAKPKYGHWCCLFKTNRNTIEFFNPYGGFPDDSLDYIPLHFREISGQLYPLLSILLYESPYNLVYNHIPFQRKSKDVKTCGRHCVLRLRRRDLSLEQYKSLLDELSKRLHLNYDELVSLITTR